jgi:hypothetical protein
MVASTTERFSNGAQPKSNRAPIENTSKTTVPVSLPAVIRFHVGSFGLVSGAAGGINEIVGRSVPPQALQNRAPARKVVPHWLHTDCVVPFTSKSYAMGKVRMGVECNSDLTPTTVYNPHHETLDRRCSSTDRYIRSCPGPVKLSRFSPTGADK